MNSMHSRITSTLGMLADDNLYHDISIQLVSLVLLLSLVLGFGAFQGISWSDACLCLWGLESVCAE